MCAQRQDPPNTRERPKLSFVAARLGVLPEVFRDRIEGDDRHKVLYLAPVEAKKLRDAYGGQLPNTYEKVRLVERAEEPRIPRGEMVEPPMGDGQPGYDPVAHERSVAIVEIARDAGEIAHDAGTVMAAVDRVWGDMLRVVPAAVVVAPSPAMVRSALADRPIPELIHLLLNPAKREDARARLIEIGRPAILQLAMGLGDPWRKEQCAEILVLISQKGRNELYEVIENCIKQLRRPNALESAKSTLTSLMDVNLGAVLVLSIDFLRSEISAANKEALEEVIIDASRKDVHLTLRCCGRLFYDQPNEYADRVASTIVSENPNAAADYFVSHLFIPEHVEFSMRILCNLAERNVRLVTNRCVRDITRDNEHVNDLLKFCADINTNTVAAICTYAAARDTERCSRLIELLVFIAQKKPDTVIRIATEEFYRNERGELLEGFFLTIAKTNLPIVVRSCLAGLRDPQRYGRYAQILEKTGEIYAKEITGIVENLRRTEDGARLVDAASAAVREAEERRVIRQTEPISVADEGSAQPIEAAAQESQPGPADSG